MMPTDNGSRYNTAAAAAAAAAAIRGIG